MYVYIIVTRSIHLYILIPLFLSICLQIVIKFNLFNIITKFIVLDFDNQIQDVIKHNIKLTHKTDLLYKQLDRFEIELTNYREKNENLETQLSSSLLQYHDIEGKNNHLR